MNVNKKVLSLAGVLFVLVIFFGCTIPSSPVANESSLLNKTSQSNKTGKRGETGAQCGGIAGLSCPDGFVCSYDDDSGIVDNMGTCVKVQAQSCGGIAGIPCPDGFVCSYDDSGIIDNAGTCVKGVKVEFIECGGFAGAACPSGFECAFDAGDGEPIFIDAFGECAPALELAQNVSGKCNVTQVYDVRSSSDVGCVCPDGFGFKDTTLGFFRTGDVEARIPGVECVRVKK